jgi:hypothetical protein
MANLDHAHGQDPRAGSMYSPRMCQASSTPRNSVS